MTAGDSTRSMEGEHGGESWLQVEMWPFEKLPQALGSG